MPPTVTDNAVISWMTVSDVLTIQKYELDFRGGHCNSPSLVAVSSANSAPDVMSISVSEELQLNKGSNYTVRVRAVNYFASGRWSESSVQLQTRRSS